MLIYALAANEELENYEYEKGVFACRKEGC